MDNFIPKGTGNSRLMKSSIPANTTLEELITMLRNGTFPYDIGEVNDEGIVARGTPLNKGTLLKDGTADKLNIPRASVPDDALQKLSAAAMWGQGNGYLKLSQLNDGDVFTLKENGVDVEFVRVGVYSDGSGNIAVMRKEALQQGTNTPNADDGTKGSDHSYYDGSSMDTYLEGTYLNLLECKDAVQTSTIKMKPYEYVSLPGGAPYDAQRKVFLPSIVEWGLGGVNSNYYLEGSPLGGFAFVHAPTNASFIATRTRAVTGYQITYGQFSVTWTGYSNASSTAAFTGFCPMFCLKPDFEVDTMPINLLKSVFGQNLGISASQIIGGVRVKTGSYVGDGTYGVDHPNSIDVGFRPMLVIVTHSDGGLVPYEGQWGQGFLWQTGVTRIAMQGTSYAGTNIISDSDTGLSWYNVDNSHQADIQLNIGGGIYYYIAIGGGLGIDGDDYTPPTYTDISGNGDVVIS